MNLNGRKVYLHEKYFGKIIADYDFERKDVQKNMNPNVLVMVAEDAPDGWYFLTRREQEVLRLKGIPFGANTRGWYIARDTISADYYVLEEMKMVMKSE